MWTRGGNAGQDFIPTAFSEMDLPIDYPIFFFSNLFLPEFLLSCWALPSSIRVSGSKELPFIKEINLWTCVGLSITAASVLCSVIEH